MKRSKITALILSLSLIFSFWGCGSNEKKRANSLNSAKKITEEINEDEPKKLISSEDVAIEFVNHNDHKLFGMTDEMNELIKSYFIRYFKALGSYEDLSFDDLFCSDSQYQYSIVNAMVSYQNGIRRDMETDMTYDSACVGVKYLSVTAVADGYDVYLVQNDYMNYNFIKDTTSYTSDIEHHFIISNRDGKYLISEHREITGAYTLIKEGFERYTANMENYDISEIFNIVKDWFVSTTDRELKGAIEAREEYNKSPERHVTALTADNAYNPEAALAYSYEWAGKTEAKRNLAQYGMYDEYGGNCNNFTSQCLFAGGIPFDLTGIQWKWYGEAVNEFGGQYGRSPSWAECDYFYQYCKENDGFGLVAELDCNLYSGRPGDLIQYMVDGNDAVHTVIITKVIYDDEGNVIDYLINSNTIDKVDCPMTAYGYTDFRLIKIIGWNNE